MSDASVQVTVVPSTVLEPLCAVTSPGNVTDTRKSVKSEAISCSSPPVETPTSLLIMENRYSPSACTTLRSRFSSESAESGAPSTSRMQPT